MGEVSRPRALVIARGPDIVVAVPALLDRAGFEVTLVTQRAEMRALRHVARFIRVRRATQVVPRALAELARGYALVVPTDDLVLQAVKGADLPLADKLQLLPIMSERGLGHIASKIGLSQALAAGGVTTPEFRIVGERSGLPAALADLGYPAMVKSDFGGGSKNVVRLDRPADLEALRPNFPFPAIVQRAIDGPTIDNSCFFKNGEPLYITNATTEATTGRNGMGLTRARRYTTRAERDTELVEQLRRLGRALDANGFVSLGAIRSNADGKLYFYEADMRPTVWVEHGKYYGEDPAAAIARGFGLPGVPPPTTRTAWPDEVVLAHGPRLTTVDVLRNRYGWRGNFENYLGRGVLWDRFDRWRVARWGGRLRPPPTTRLSNLVRRLRRRLFAGSTR